MELWEDLAEPKPVLLWPEKVMNQPSQQEGDKMLTQFNQNPSLLFLPDTSSFMPARQNLAIGGLQIVDSRFVRKYGYIDHDTKFHKPIDLEAGEKQFNTREDSKFRKHIAKMGFGKLKIDLPNLYRLRHTETSYR